METIIGLTKKQQKVYNKSIPYKNLICDKCGGKLIYNYKEFIDGKEIVCNRCLFYYKCKTCKNRFKIYSDGEVLYYSKQGNY